MNRKQLLFIVGVFVAFWVTIYALPTATVENTSIGDGDIVNEVTAEGATITVQYKSSSNISHINLITPSGELRESQDVYAGASTYSYRLSVLPFLAPESGVWTVAFVSDDGEVLDTAEVTIGQQWWSL